MKLSFGYCSVFFTMLPNSPDTRVCSVRSSNEYPTRSIERKWTISTFWFGSRSLATNLVCERTLFETIRIPRCLACARGQAFETGEQAYRPG